MSLVLSVLWVIFFVAVVTDIILAVLLYQEVQQKKYWEAEAYRLGEKLNEYKYSRRLR